MCVGSARCRQESRNFWGRLVSGVQSRLKAKPAARNSAILSCRSSALCALRSEQGGARHGRSGNCPLLQELLSLFYSIVNAHGCTEREDGLTEVRRDQPLSFRRPSEPCR